MSDHDLPPGYRWAREDEMDRPDAIAVRRTVDSNGSPYLEGEADLAVPIAQGESRSYIVGLPVLVTVWDDGTVVYDIDTSETDSAVMDSWYEEPAQEVPYKQMVDDVEAIQRDHVRRMEEGQ